MKGYEVKSGYMGFYNGKYQLFETEDEYKAMYREAYET